MSNITDTNRPSAKPAPVKALKPNPQAKARPTRMARRDPRRKRG